jgi:hypothetical protein
MEEEIKELHQYARNTFDRVVQWFTFFANLSFIAAGFFAAKVDFATPAQAMLLAVCVYFVVQCVLGVVVGIYIRRYFRETGKRIDVLLQQTGERTSDAVVSPYPSQLYNRLMILMVLALSSLTVLWTFFCVQIASLPPTPVANPPSQSRQ